MWRGWSRHFAAVMLSLVLVVPEPALGAHLTQRDWMKSLVAGLGLSFGLPDEPEDADYLRILSGRRTLRIEAEEALNPESLVSIKDFPHFGPFSGSGWVSGIAMPTTAHLSFLLPLRGTYEVSVVVRLAEHVIHLGGQEFVAAGGHEFTRVELGSVDLEAGLQEVIVHLPPNGAIDFFELRAADFTAVEPLGGWRLDRLLMREDLAATALRALDLLDSLPAADSDLLFEAEDAPEQGGASVVSIRYLGAPSGGRWLRATTAPAEVILPIRVDRPGVYRLNLTGVGNQPSGVQVNDEPPRKVAWPSFLAEASVGSFFLDAGEHRVRVDLPPGSGLDVLRLQKLSSDAEALTRLCGLVGGFGPAQAGEVDDLLALLAGLGAFF
ncbi:hypothetical protein [Geoalkalibacter halelectricus]|uniref:Uncharacterized protein n=1 Tax=Geoalkalibacter halelectricus TaxID=2847045 RepID=A0ABY5ZK86_9BACT|nr:hypothetical protein [Geoalkalibacter halelectricus]MDO3376828.1 hypothetical protein [Geoalkalibacter halelectricus]UWZ79106.1 hypothetical protein L9S41_15690 [Geoalkalibacter halelectricus]